MRAALIAASVLIMSACNVSAEAQEGGGRGKDRTDRRSFDVGAFDSVSLGGYQDVVVTVGPAVSVRAEGPASELDRLDISVDDGDLRIRTKRDGFRMGGTRPVTVFVTAPRLTAAAIGGSGDMRIDRVEGRSFKASIGGSGDLSVASLRVSDASFSIAGSGSLRAAGEAERQSISIAGSGDIDTSDLRGRTADVSVVGSGDVRAYASQTASVSVMGSGDVVLGGGARCTVSKRGSGSVRCS